MQGLIQIPVTKETMEEKDSALQPPVLIIDPGEKYAGKKRSWQGIPSIARTRKKRTFICFYSGGEDEGPNNYCLLIKSDDNGENWSKPILAIDPPGKVRAFDPCVWFSPDGCLYLFWAQSFGGFDGRAGCWYTICQNPDNNKLIWSEPIRIADGVMLNKPLVRKNGEWLLPISLWKSIHSEYNAHMSRKLANVYVSIDQGRSFEWRSGVDMEDRYYDEHMLVEKEDGSLWMLVRLLTGIGEAFSADGGRNWKDIRRSNIWGPNARFFITRLHSGALLLVNHAKCGEWKHGDSFSKRDHLSAYLSMDDGETWSEPLLLDERENAAYPDGVEDRDGTIYVVYDHERFSEKEILMAKFREEDILAGKLICSGSRLRICVDKAGKDRAEGVKAR